MFPAPNMYLSRLIRMWAKFYQKTGELPIIFQGKHQKVCSLIEDEDVALQCRAIFRGIKRNLRTAESFMDAVNSQFVAVKISLATSKRWLLALGFFSAEIKKGTYKDGHALPEVIIDRETRFCPTINAFRILMDTFQGDNREIVVPPVLCPGEQRHIHFNHDECCFSSDSGRKRCWQERGHEPMQPKRGVSMMVSAIISPFGLESERIIQPGRIDEYWCNRDLVKQFMEDIPKIELKYPGVKQVHQVDNSANHHAMAPDALVASRLNLGNGFPKLLESDKEAGIAVTPFRDTTWVDMVGVIHSQTFALFEDSLNPKKITSHKGLKAILEERNLFRHTVTTILLPECPVAEGFFGPYRPSGLSCKLPRMLLPEATEVLASQPDFVAQSNKNWLQETVEGLGHILIFGPKFSPELAPIELFWGECKRFTRSNCDYSLKGLQRNVPLALLSVPLETFRRHYDHVYRYMQGYLSKTPLSPRALEWKV